MRLSRSCWVAVMMAAWVAPAVCSGRLQAQSSEYASLIDEGVREFGVGNFVEARSLFERAHAISPNARTFRALGLCAFELKHYTQAVSELEAARDDPRKPLPPDLAEAVAATLVRAKRFIGELHVVTEPADSQLQIDGVPQLGRQFELDVGDHLIGAGAPGYDNRALTVAIAGMQKQTVKLVLPRLDVSSVPAPPAQRAAEDLVTSRTEPVDRGPALTERWWFWTALGVVVVAGVSTAVAMSLDDRKPYAGTSGVTLSAQ
jgi:hypothetical protein